MGPRGRARLRAAASATAFAVLAACSGGGDSRDSADDEAILGGIGDGTTTSSSSVGDAGKPNGGPGEGPGVTTTVRGQTTTTAKGIAGTSTTARPGAPTTTAKGSTGSPSDTGARGVPGAYARTVLQAQRSERVVIEPLVQQGAAPLQATLDHVTRLLREASAKPVTVAATVALPQGDGSTDDAEIRQLSDQYARTPQGPEQAVIRLLFLAGEYSPTRSVLGVAVRGDTAAVFPQQVRRVPLVPSATLERAVAAHELGHLLGLVDLVIDTGRDDPRHQGHSQNEQSVMYYAIETTLVGQVMEGPPPTEFDDDDRRDLATIRHGG